MKKGQEREDREAEEKVAKNNAHRILLNQQIQRDRDYKKSVSNDNLDEGNRFRQDLIRDEEKFKSIRDNMINDLVGKGVNPRYLTEMKNLDIGKILKR